MFVAVSTRTMANARPKIVDDSETWVGVEEMRQRKRDDERRIREASIERGQAMAAAEWQREQRASGKTFMDKWRRRRRSKEVLSYNSLKEIEAARISAAGTLANPKATPFERIEARAIRVFGVTRTEMRGRQRFDRIVFARFFISYWMRRLTDLSYPQIGRKLGGIDHTSVLYGCGAYRSRRAQMGRTLREVR